MVFCGKPSGGCHSCRAKKTRCDQNPEGCGQCKKAKRECPGYRVPGDVIFRNESDNVIKKFKAKEARTKTKAVVKFPASLPMPAEGSDVDSEESMEVVRQFVPALSYALAQSIEERATIFFVANYIIGDSGPTRGHLDYLQDLYHTDTLPESLMTSIQAVGLAGYAHAVRAPSLKLNARYLYVRALRATNAALRSPTEVKKDSTLMAIMVLQIFETITGCNRLSLTAWAEHVAGAAALLQLRGPEQLNTRSGRRMFIQASSALMISCIQRGLYLPDFVPEWSAEAKKLMSAPDASWIIQELMMEFTNFNASVMDGSCSDLSVILSKSLDLDSRYQHFYTNVPPGWEYETIVLSSDSPDYEFVYNGRYHLYYDYWIAQMWNGMRTVRLILHEFIRSVLLEGISATPPIFTKPEHTTQLQVSMDTLFEMQADILSSVPQHLGVTQKPKPKPTSPSAAEAPRCFDRTLAVFPWTNFSEHNDETFPLVRASGPYFLMWPLWFSGALSISTKEVKQFVTKNLRAIGEKMGIHQALFLANMIETQTAIKFNANNKY